MEFHELLERIGVDAPATVARLGGMESILEALYPEISTGPDLHALAHAYDIRDMKALEQPVHTLNGLTANLGIEPLRQLSAEYLEQIRTAVPPSELTTYQRQLTQEYRRVTQSITQFLAEQTG